MKSTDNHVADTICRTTELGLAPAVFWNEQNTKQDTRIRNTPHYGRVFLITQLAEAGMTPAAIGSILGQKDLKTITEVYMRVSEDKTAQILTEVGHHLEE